MKNEYVSDFDIPEILERTFGDYGESEDAPSDEEQILMVTGLVVKALEDLKSRVKGVLGHALLETRVNLALQQMTDE